MSAEKSVLQFIGGDGAFVVCVICGAAAACVLWRRKVDRRFLVWRLCILAAVLFIAGQPAIVRREAAARPLIAVAVDTSKSMRLTGRLKNGVRLLQESAGVLGKNGDVRWYAFAASSGEVKKTVNLEKNRFGQSTDIARSLWEIRHENGENLSGIVLLSDGNQTGPAPRDGWIEELGVPVTVLSPAPAARATDAAASSVQVGDFAFKNTPLEVAVSVTAIGLAGKKLDVRIITADKPPRILATAGVSPATDNEVRETLLRFTPEASGRFKYIAEVSPVPGELTLVNNRLPFELEVMRDKTRVLFLCGQPGPEYAFLRHALKSNPSIDLVSFVILRNPENIVLVPENDLSLIPFPVHELFTRDLKDFDILIFENFTYQGFGFVPEYLANIRQWVSEKGGGLVMTGGEHSFGSGGWANTPVADLLPVECEPPQERPDRTAFAPRVEDYAQGITALDADRKKNESFWRALPPLEGSPLLKAKPGSTVLLRHPWNNAAVLTAGETGKGRVIALSTNTTWRWALGAPTPEAYTRFWDNIIRYLSRRGDQQKLTVVFDRPGYFEGQEYTIRVRTADRLPGRTLEVAGVDPAGNRCLLPASGNSRHEWKITGSFRETGKYSFTLTLLRNGSPVCRQTVAQEVAASLQQEESHLGVNEDFLREIAEKSGGRYIAAASFNAGDLPQRMKKQKAAETIDKTPLFNSPAVLGLVFLGLMGEWYMRRRKGYL